MGSAVRVKHQALWSVAGGIGFAESGDSKVHILSGRQMPGNDLAGKKVNDNTEVIPFSAGAQISNIAYPNKIRGALSKALPEMIGTDGVIGTAEIMFGMSSRHFRQMHRAHQAVHSSDADADAIVALEDMMDFVGAKALVVISINIKDKASKILIKRNTGSRRGIKMFIVSASVDIQDTTKGLDAMLKTKPVDSV